MEKIIVFPGGGSWKVLTIIAVIILIALGIYVVFKLSTAAGILIIILTILFATVVFLGTTALIIQRIEEKYGNIINFFDQLNKQWRNLTKAIVEFFDWLKKSLFG